MPLPPKWTRSAGHQAWPAFGQVNPTTYKCGFCGDKVSSEKGIGYVTIGRGQSENPGILICPSCNGPTFVYPGTGELFPAASIGASVNHVPAEITALFEEARGCATGSHFTGAVLICRKLLMHIAVSLGAKEGLPFIQYVDYLVGAGYVPPNGKHWVDHIRKKGNEATHEIVRMKHEDAKDLITFLEMLLRFIYEFPSSIPKNA